ncbi:hypothetical protein GCM10011369_11190 [Neiella marina]|uniref:Uncharacterized protein n=1 Tax=Neiella marina TaxID=508461 RepID=A0A8J2XLP6_9GAMM|nr:hypothetical protein [Neiella marina]GGA71196.1 hypothetical protein GCM10011369_11190 [Neiella marina]
MDSGHLLHVVVVTGLLVAIVSGLAMLGLIMLSVWRGMREMGVCRNDNELGTDVSYSDQHGEPRS